MAMQCDEGPCNHTSHMNRQILGTSCTTVDLSMWILCFWAMWALVVRLCLAPATSLQSESVVFVRRLREVVKLQRCSSLSALHA